jgi:hypothetical protein
MASLAGEPFGVSRRDREIASRAHGPGGPDQQMSAGSGWQGPFQVPAARTG